MEMKEKDKDNVCENISLKNQHQSNDDRDKRKSASKKRKKDENENHEAKLVILKKKKKENITDKFNLKHYDKHLINNEEKTKSKCRKRKKDENETQEINFHEEFHDMRITKDVCTAVNSINEEKKILMKRRKENFDERCYGYEEKEYIDNGIPNYKQSDVLKTKKKKKMKNIEMDKLDLEDNDKMCNDYKDGKEKKYKKKKRLKKLAENAEIRIDILNINHDDEKSKKIKNSLPNYSQIEVFKKKKKNIKEKFNKDNSNIEIGKVNKSNDEEEGNLIQDEDTESTEQLIPVENTVLEESNEESIQSMYSHEYTNDPSRFTSRNVISKTGKKDKKKKSTIEMYEDFIYKLPLINDNQLGAVENIPEEGNYWHKHAIKYKVNDYPQEEIQKDLLERVECVADYFDRFAMDNLTAEECQEKEVLNFNGPYLPTPRHIKFFGALDIELDWEMSEEQQYLLSFHNRKDLRESGVFYITEAFDRSEDSILLENWQEFKEQYKFDDLRPLLSFRTMTINHEEGCYNFKSVDYINEDERHKFCMFMARGLENRNIFQIRRRLLHLALRIRYYGISYDPLYIEPREAAEIEAFIKLFGTNYKGMEFIIGKLNFSRYQTFSQIYVKYKNMPIRLGQWQSTEKCRLVRSIFKATGASNIQELLHSKVMWKEVFLLMQTRFHHQCNHFFKNYMSRFLELASHISNHETDSGNIYWTASDRVKLIMLVSENLGPTVCKVDWEEVSSHFEVFGPFSCAHQFRNIYYKMVPRNKKKRDSMGEAVDYLLEFVVPMIEKGELTFKEEKLNLEELRSLPLKKGQALQSADKWSLRNTIKLIEEVYENAGSSVETTNWDEICSYFKEYDEKDCRNHFRYLYYNRVPHQHRESFDTALEYLKNRICPMLENKKQRNRKEFLLTEEVLKLSSEDRLILQALLNDISHADDDEDIAMLQEENYEKLSDQNSQSTSNDSHESSETMRFAKLNALSDYIQEKQDEEDLDESIDDISISDDKLESYIDDFDKEENENLNLHLSTDYEFEDNNIEIRD